mmetsp:Transcript_28078/g.56600  ORF Transcript_28078/g.56600 Transcript_28078/m.56600 type:complete len:98 (-) Transcript_28078:238-531(-)
MSALYQDCFPCRIKKFVVVDPPLFMHALVGIARLVVKAKLIKRIVFTSSDKLHEHFDAAMLPPELGGTRTEDFFAERGPTFYLVGGCVGRTVVFDMS